MLGKTFLGVGGFVALLIAGGTALIGGCGSDDTSCTFATDTCAPSTSSGPMPCTTPADCDDMNDCTDDTCAMSVCVHEALPNFITDCTGSRNNTCYEGACVGFESTLTTTSTHSFVRDMDMQKTVVSSGIAVGADGAPTAYDPVVLLVNEADLSTSIVHEAPTAGMPGDFRSIAGRLAVGAAGVVATTPSPTGTMEWTAPPPDVATTTDLDAVFALPTGETTAQYFVGGIGNPADEFQNVVRRCDYDGSQASPWGAAPCSILHITPSEAICSTSARMDVHGIFAASKDKAWFAGSSVGPTGDVRSTVAFYDGNNKSMCEGGFNGYSGEVWIDNGDADTIVPPDEGVIDASLLDIHGSSGDNVWACGKGGVILHYDGSTWTRQDPADDDIDWSIAHTCAGVWATETDVFFAGQGAAISAPTCTHAFLLHARKDGDTWAFDKKTIFSFWSSCDANGASKVQNNHVEMDPSGTLWLGGSTTDVQQNQVSIIVRLKKPE
jgi:hypothetical protein